MNLEGAFKKVVNYSAGGDVFTDDRGVIIAFNGRVFRGIDDEYATESETLRFALFEALNHGFKKLVIEMDNFHTLRGLIRPHIWRITGKYFFIHFLGFKSFVRYIRNLINKRLKYKETNKKTQPDEAFHQAMSQQC